MSFFAELKRRNVVRVGVAYIVIGWLLVQVAEFAFENFDAPEWVLKTFVVVVLLGLPLALFFAWAFELTPEGLELDQKGYQQALEEQRERARKTGKFTPASSRTDVVKAIEQFPVTQFLGYVQQQAQGTLLAMVKD